MKGERTMKGLLMFFASVAVFMHGAALFAGSVCTWQGGSGKFSETTKWDTVPVSGNGDTLVFNTTDGTAITVENDLVDDFSVSNVVFATKDIDAGDCGKVTLAGNRLYISGGKNNDTLVWSHGGATVKDRGPVVDVDLPLRIKTGRVDFSRAVTFKRKVTIDDDGYVALRWPGSLQYKNNYPSVTFEDEVVGAWATIDNSVGKGGDGSHIYYKSKVTLKAFNVNAKDWGDCKAHLEASENDISTVWARYAKLYLEGSPSLKTNTVVTLSKDTGNTQVYIYGADVAIDRLATAEKTTSVHQSVNGGTTATRLTMKATADATTGANFLGNLSLVWDPQGSKTYTLTDSASTMNKTLEVKGGTFKLKGSTAFSALSEVIVRSGAVLDLSESTAATPFAATTKLTVDVGGAVVAPAGGVTFASGTYRGLPLVAGDYSTDWVSSGTVTVSNGPESGVCYWARPEDGDWNVAANWIPEGVPGATDEVRILAQGASGYTVRMTGTETKPARIVVGSGIAAKAALSIAGEANFTKGTKINVNRGGEIVVPSGGSFVYDMVGNTPVTATLVQIENGRFVVDGGYATFTNSLGVVKVGGEDGEMLVENGGELVLADAAGGTTGPLTVERGATLRMTGGSIVIPSKYWNSYLVQRSGGKSDFSGGTLSLVSSGQPNQTRFYGDTTFSKSATWNKSGDVRTFVGPNDDYGSATFTVRDNATSTGGNNYFLQIGIAGIGRTTTFLWDSPGSLSAGLGYIGVAKGTSRYRQTNGSVAFNDYKGLCVGMTTLEYGTGSDAADNAVEGAVELVGGTLTVSGQTATRDAWDGVSKIGFPPGTILGYGATAKPPASGRPYVGRMTVSGGSFTNQYGHLFVGVAPYGEGSLVVTGGVVRSGTLVPVAYAEVVGCAVGVGGGKGEFRIGGGDCQIDNNTWIGGVATNAVRVLAKGSDSTYPFETHGGEGLLEVYGGRAAFGRDLVVGAEGTGVVSVVGSAASQFTVGRNLVLSNAADVVVGGTEAATLRFKPDAGGITPISVAGKFVVTDTAKMEIDLSDYDIRSAENLPLLTCASKEGDFGAGRIVLAGCDPTKVVVQVSDTGVYVGPQKGFIVIFR